MCVSFHLSFDGSVISSHVRFQIASMFIFFEQFRIKWGVKNFWRNEREQKKEKERKEAAGPKQRSVMPCLHKLLFFPRDYNLVIVAHTLLSFHSRLSKIAMSWLYANAKWVFSRSLCMVSLLWTFDAVFFYASNFIGVTYNWQFSFSSLNNNKTKNKTTVWKNTIIDSAAPMKRRNREMRKCGFWPL